MPSEGHMSITVTDETNLELLTIIEAAKYYGLREIREKFPYINLDKSGIVNFMTTDFLTDLKNHLTEKYGKGVAEVFADIQTKVKHAEEERRRKAREKRAARLATSFDPPQA
jgi:hypothetical protein